MKDGEAPSCCVHVEWEDACYEEQPQLPADVQRAWPMWNSGYLVEESEDRIVLALAYSPTDGRFAHTSSIPRGCVRRTQIFPLKGSGRSMVDIARLRRTLEERRARYELVGKIVESSTLSWVLIELASVTDG